MNNNLIDVKENYIYHLDNELLEILLKDRSSGKNIIWATDNYASRGCGYQSFDQITVESITGHHGNVVKPRTEKSKKEQSERIRQKAEVFTPSWICNKQNNLVDNAWFGSENAFNNENEKTWISTKEKIVFPTVSGKSWEDYINDTRLEITCGEAPYLVSRYDTVTGEYIEIDSRIGLLDRKLRVLSENTESEEEWIRWATIAYQNIYGFDWQGDNVLLARENLLFTFIDYYKAKFNNEDPSIELLREIAEILSWNIWQMDGLKFVIPNSCKDVEIGQTSLFDLSIKTEPCPGCENNDPFAHTGVKCKIIDWKADPEGNNPIEFVLLTKENGYGK